jgi:hypothetical protein
MISLVRTTMADHQYRSPGVRFIHAKMLAMMGAARSSSQAWTKRMSMVLMLGLLCLPAALRAEVIGVFFDSTIPQSSFAASEVQAALVSKGYTTEMLGLSTLSSATSTGEGAKLTVYMTVITLNNSVGIKGDSMALAPMSFSWVIPTSARAMK